MINTKLESDCSNGMMAMIKAWKCYNIYNPTSSPIMKDIEKYNEFDCNFTLFDILHFLMKLLQLIIIYLLLIINY